ncbi:MAG: VWA domain-containing protein [Mycolicibacterium sp.]|uniref:vWA domain-containing protein n=1 Tax=Mycolicibacterium sp. TaxID=2320850 RepID=UPI000FAED305|nr:vWA domain-containing protein [Mycolicibacterium sp.]RUP32992.1 MAG: VWA domain-containing protein [Mycolicibacterium sp.]
MVHVLKPAGDLRPLGSRRKVSWPRLLLLLVLVALLIGLPLWWYLNRDDPDSLDHAALVGQRGPGCARIIIASDESGSMEKFVQPRNHALAQLLSWAPNNLRDDDELEAVVFSGDTFVAMPPTEIRKGPVLGRTPPPVDGTTLVPLLNTIQRMPPSHCAQSLILLSDGIFQDLPAGADAARRQLKDAGIGNLFLLVPGKKIKFEPSWQGLYPYAAPVIFDGLNSDKTGLAIGHALASITGQQLKERK